MSENSVTTIGSANYSTRKASWITYPAPKLIVAWRWDVYQRSKHVVGILKGVELAIAYSH